MSKMRWVNTEFWTDTWVVDHLNPLDRYLFIYLFTNPYTNLTGAYELSLRIMSFETGIEREQLLNMLKRLEPRVKYVDGWIILKNGIKHQNYRNQSINTGIRRECEAIPSEILQHTKWPKDFGEKPIIGSKQTSLLGGVVDDTLHSTVTKPNLTTTVGRSEQPKPVDKTDSRTTAETTGLNKMEGRKYSDITMLYDDLLAQGLVNAKFKAWYCGAFFKLGRDKVMVLASQAKADGKDPIKLFSHLIQKESGVKAATGLSK